MSSLCPTLTVVRMASSRTRPPSPASCRR
jgi:hypothetical protein